MKKYLSYITLSLILAAIIIVGIFIRHNQTVHIAYLSDSKYVPYTMVSINSAILNKNYKSKYYFHIIALDFSAEDIRKLKSMEQKNVVVEIHSTSAKEMNIEHLGRFASFSTALQKIFIAETLSKINKVLYLDADTLVQQDLSKLYKSDISDKYVAAVKDGLMYQFPEHIAELLLKNRNFYFNSGVMLLNLQKIREDRLIKKAMIYFNTHNEIFGDQDIFNVVFSGKTLPLSHKYNCSSVFFTEKSAAFLSDFYQEKILESPKNVYKNAVILHFSGHKPWTEWFAEPYLRFVWRIYAQNTAAKYGIAF